MLDINYQPKGKKYTRFGDKNIKIWRIQQEKLNPKVLSIYAIK